MCGEAGYDVHPARGPCCLRNRIGNGSQRDIVRRRHRAGSAAARDRRSGRGQGRRSPLASAVAVSAVRRCPAASYGAHFYAPGKGKTVALTFDDGPGRTTAAVLRVLARYRVPATFFNIGVNVAARPGLARKEVRAAMRWATIPGTTRTWFCCPRRSKPPRWTG